MTACCPKRPQRQGCWGQRLSSVLVAYPGRFLEESGRGSLEGWLDPTELNQTECKTEQIGWRKATGIYMQVKQAGASCANTDKYTHVCSYPPSHTCIHFSFTCHTLFSLYSLSYILHEWQKELHRVNTLKAHNQYYDRRSGNTVKGVEASTDKGELCLVSLQPSC